MTRSLIVSFVAVLCCSLVAEWRIHYPDVRCWIPVETPNDLGAENDCIAKAIRSGKGFANPFRSESGPTSWMPPVLPTLIASLYFVFGDNRNLVIETVKAIQIMVITFVGTLIIEFAKQRRMERIGLIVFVLMLGCHFNELFQKTHDGWLLLGLFSVLFVLYGRLSKSSTTALLALWGTIGGISTLSGPVLGFVWLVATFDLIIQSRFTPRRGWVGGILILATIVAPWMIRNYIIFNAIIPVKSNLYFELWQSQCLDADGVLDSSVSYLHPWCGPNQQHDEYILLGERAFLEQKRKAVLESIESDPGNFAWRIVNRFTAATLFYQPVKPQLERFVIPLVVKRLLFPIPFVCLIAICLTRRIREESFLRFSILAYIFWLLPYVVVSYYDRYAMPLFGVKSILILGALSMVRPMNNLQQAENGSTEL